MMESDLIFDRGAECVHNARNDLKIRPTLRAQVKNRTTKILGNEPGDLAVGSALVSPQNE